MKNTSKKIKNAPTKDDLEKLKQEAKKYTDEKIKVHEDKQILEITSIKNDVSEMKGMVQFLYESAISKSK